MYRAVQEHRERLMAQPAVHLSVATHVEDLPDGDGAVHATVGDGIPVRLRVERT